MHGLSDQQQFLTACDERANELTPEADLLGHLLTLANPRSTHAGEVSRILECFGSLGAAISADADALQAEGISPRVAFAFKLVRETAVRLLAVKVRNAHVISSWADLIAYCTARMAHNDTEQFRVIYLDRKNRLIRDEVQQRGTVDHTPVYPREVARRCLQLNASAVIMCHNHPSGDPTPSRADIEMTNKVKAALVAIDCTLHDHLVISCGGHVSFRTQGLL